MQTVVDLSRLRHNVRRIRAALKNGFCAVVKAQAYGHGTAVAPYIEQLSDCYMTANYCEASELSCMGIKKPILVIDHDISQAFCGKDPLIVPAVSSARDAELLIRSGRRRFSVAVNTGMNRLGADSRALAAIVGVCKRYDVAPFSVYSHIYNGIASAAEQSDEFDRLTRGEPILCKNRHLYSSCALDVPQNYLYDMTRCGIAMYGYAQGLDIAMRVRAQIAAISRVSAGSHVGYGDCVLDRDAVVATVRCGYADGLRRTRIPLYMRVRGKKCSVIGMSCMDMCMIDVTGVSCRVGEFAYLIAQKEDAEYLAKAYDTIIYEVLTGFNGRAQRIYV